MIAVLPLLLYPLLGMSFFQVAQFMGERPTRVLIVGLPALDDLPSLVEQGQFATDLYLPREKRHAGSSTERPPDQDDEDYARSQARLLQARPGRWAGVRANAGRSFCTAGRRRAEPEDRCPAALGWRGGPVDGRVDPRAAGIAARQVRSGRRVPA